MLTSFRSLLVSAVAEGLIFSRFKKSPPAPVSRSKQRKHAQLAVRPDPEGAAKYLARKSLPAGCSSTLKKVQRAKRIAAGVRPARF